MERNQRLAHSAHAAIHAEIIRVLTKVAVPIERPHESVQFEFVTEATSNASIVTRFTVEYYGDENQKDLLGAFAASFNPAEYGHDYEMLLTEVMGEMFQWDRTQAMMAYHDSLTMERGIVEAALASVVESDNSPEELERFNVRNIIGFLQSVVNASIDCKCESCNKLKQFATPLFLSTLAEVHKLPPQDQLEMSMGSKEFPIKHNSYRMAVVACMLQGHYSPTNVELDDAFEAAGLEYRVGSDRTFVVGLGVRRRIFLELADRMIASVQEFNAVVH